MKAFITGSHAYGVPRPDSDIDLVVLVSKEDAGLLWRGVPDGESLRFAHLNLIALYSESSYEKWLVTTEMLKRRAPVSREDAVAAFQAVGVGADYTRNTRHEPKAEGER